LSGAGAALMQSALQQLRSEVTVDAQGDGQGSAVRGPMRASNVGGRTTRSPSPRVSNGVVLGGLSCL